jgi:hypothetical protein
VAAWILKILSSIAVPERVNSFVVVLSELVPRIMSTEERRTLELVDGTPARVLLDAHRVIASLTQV